MATTSIIPAGRRMFQIDKEFSALGEDVGLELQGSESIPAVAAILNGVSAFPPGNMDAVALNFKSSTGATVPLGDPLHGTVTFSAHGSAGFQANVVTGSAAALKALSPIGATAAGPQLSGTEGERFLILQLHYDAGLTAKGTAALAPAVSATFGGAVSRTGEWAVIHRFGEVPAFKAVEDTFRAWVLPRQIDGVDRLRPGTWIVAEVDGSFAVNLGVQAGYSFSWLRELPGGVLEGDLGLKLEAAAATLAFSANGTYILALARETSAPVIRLSLSKAGKRGWDFAVSSGASAVLTAKPGDLAAAILGIHPAQLAEDLKTLGPEYSDVLKLWDKLGAQPAGTLLAIAAIHTPAELQQFSTLLGEIASCASSGMELDKILDRELARAEFFRTALGQFLGTLAELPLTPVVNTSVAKRIGELAGAARDLLNRQVPSRLTATLDKLPPFAQAESWLKAKLAAFLGKPAESYTEADHQKMQAFHAALIGKAGQFLGSAMKAVEKQYEAKFVATYQTATSDSALIDAEFDFGENPGLLPVLQAAIQGDFRRILVEPVSGVRLKHGVLTHGLARQIHAELTLPFYDRGSDAVMSSLAKVTAKDDGGRVLTYELTATDELTSFVKAKAVRDSKMTVATLCAGRLAGVRTFGGVDASFGYSLRAGIRGLTADQLEKQMAPIQAEYFAGRFEAGQTLHDWVGTGLIGDSLLALDVSVGSEAATEWFAAPADPAHQIYFSFSRLMQARLKAMIADLYFSDADRYTSLLTAAPVLVWASLPPMNALDGRDIVWDTSRSGSFEAIARSAQTRQTLWSTCARIKPLLDSDPKRCRSASWFDVADPRLAQTNLDNLLNAALRLPSFECVRPPVLGALVDFEQEVIRSAVRAAVSAARFRAAAAGDKPGDAIRQLSEFGADVVTAFHEKLRTNLAVPQELLVPLGTSLFVEAGRALGTARLGGENPVRPRAMFSLTVLKPGLTLTPEQLVGGNFQPGQIAMEQKIASLLDF